MNLFVLSKVKIDCVQVSTPWWEGRKGLER